MSSEVVTDVRTVVVPYLKIHQALLLPRASLMMWKHEICLFCLLRLFCTFRLSNPVLRKRNRIPPWHLSRLPSQFTTRGRIPWFGPQLRRCTTCRNPIRPLSRLPSQFTTRAQIPRLGSRLRSCSPCRNPRSPVRRLQPPGPLLLFDNRILPESVHWRTGERGTTRRLRLPRRLMLGTRRNRRTTGEGGKTRTRRRPANLTGLTRQGRT
jgi:hypothetical protein